MLYQLPIYGEPEPVQFERVPEWETAFHRQVSRARKWTWLYLDSIQVFWLAVVLIPVIFFKIYFLIFYAWLFLLKTFRELNGLLCADVLLRNYSLTLCMNYSTRSVPKIFLVILEILGFIVPFSKKTWILWAIKIAAKGSASLKRLKNTDLNCS